MYSHRLISGMPVPLATSPIQLPMADCSVHASFPPPAEDFLGKRMDIAELLVEHPQETYILRVAGPSMQDYGIEDGDLIVVDRALRAKHASIVVAVVDGEFTVKALHQVNGVFQLKAGNPAYPDIVPEDDQSLEIWGVVKSCIKRFT